MEGTVYPILLSISLSHLLNDTIQSLIPSIYPQVKDSFSLTFAQIGLITLIGLSAKNAILIVEFAKERVDKGIDVIHATLQAVQLRLRPIVMTSLAFIFGVLPLAFATGAAAESRKTIGWTVFGGMIAATTLAIFVVPVLFVLITKISYGRKLRKIEESRREEENVDRNILEGHT